MTDTLYPDGRLQAPAMLNPDGNLRNQEGYLTEWRPHTRVSEHVYKTGVWIAELIDSRGRHIRQCDHTHRSERGALRCANAQLKAERARQATNLETCRQALSAWLAAGGAEPDWSKAPTAREYFDARRALREQAAAAVEGWADNADAQAAAGADEDDDFEDDRKGAAYLHQDEDEDAPPAAGAEPATSLPEAPMSLPDTYTLKQTQALIAALQVLVLDPRTRAYLEDRDVTGLEQAQEALRQAGAPATEADMVRANAAAWRRYTDRRLAAPAAAGSDDTGSGDTSWTCPYCQLVNDGAATYCRRCGPGVAR